MKLINLKNLKYYFVQKPSLVKGFTLLESLVAIAIIFIAIATSFGIVPQGQVAIQRIKNQMIANYLAQEAVEVVRAKRDAGMFFGFNISPSADWLNDGSAVNIEDCLTLDPENPVRCMVDGLNGRLIVCAIECEPLLIIQDGQGRNIYGNGTPFLGGEESIYTRWVEINIVENETGALWERSAYDSDGFNTPEDSLSDLELARDIEFKVEAHIVWETPTEDKEIIMTNNLFNWFK